MILPMFSKNKRPRVFNVAINFKPRYRQPQLLLESVIDFTLSDEFVYILTTATGKQTLVPYETVLYISKGETYEP
jgi:hypothetical protein